MAESRQTSASGQMEDLIKKVWPRWEVEKLLGEGAYGCVFKAKREDLGGTYYSAIKVVGVPKTEAAFREAFQDGMDEESATSYFKNIVEIMVREFALLDQLKGNSHIVSYEDHEVIQRESGKGWDILIRMELLTPLGNYMMEHPFTQRDVVKLGMDISKALVLCEKHNIVHRDIKPENVFVSALGDFKLGDFGVARTAEQATSGMSVRGTYSYMAPEVYKGQEYNLTVDIYSLGVMLYRLCNYNRAPFVPLPPNPITLSDKERSENLRMNGTAFPDAAEAGPELMAVIRKAVAYNPKERYLHAADLLRDLEIIYKRMNNEDIGEAELSVNPEDSAQIEMTVGPESKAGDSEVKKVQKEKTSDKPMVVDYDASINKLTEDPGFTSVDMTVVEKEKAPAEKLPKGVLGNIIFNALLVFLPAFIFMGMMPRYGFESSVGPFGCLYALVTVFVGMLGIENVFLDNKKLLPPRQYYGAAFRTGLIGSLVMTVILEVVAYLDSHVLYYMRSVLYTMGVATFFVFFITFWAKLLWNEGKRKTAAIPLIPLYLVVTFFSLIFRTESFGNDVDTIGLLVIMITLIFTILYTLLALISLKIKKDNLLKMSKYGEHPLKLQVTTHLPEVVYVAGIIIYWIIYEIVMYDSPLRNEYTLPVILLIFLSYAIWTGVKREALLKNISVKKAFGVYAVSVIVAFIIFAGIIQIDFLLIMIPVAFIALAANYCFGGKKLVNYIGLIFAFIFTIGFDMHGMAGAILEYVMLALLGVLVVFALVAFVKNKKNASL